MLNADHIVITPCAQRAHDIRPLLDAVTITHRAEIPRARANIAVGLHISQAIHVDIVLIQPGIFGMEVMNRPLFTQDLNGGDRIDPLPPQMTGVEVGANSVAGCFTQFQ